MSKPKHFLRGIEKIMHPEDLAKKIMPEPHQKIILSRMEEQIVRDHTKMYVGRAFIFRAGQALEVSKNPQGYSVNQVFK